MAPFNRRVKTDLLTENICRNLKLKLDLKETTSLKKAWKNIEVPLSVGKAVGLKLDCYHLDYFTNKIHFAGHYVAMYGFDKDYAYLVDTKQQGGSVRTSLRNLELARNEKGPMSSRNRSYTTDQIQDLPDLSQVIKKAIYDNATTYLNPPIKNFGYKGIKKSATEIKKWYNTSKDIKTEFQTSAMLMERAGTGGALFRNLYRDFLKEAVDSYGMTELEGAHSAFVEYAIKWTEISKLFHRVGETQDKKYPSQASELFLQLAEEEKATMENLRWACS